MLFGTNAFQSILTATIGTMLSLIAQHIFFYKNSVDSLIFFIATLAVFGAVTAFWIHLRNIVEIQVGWDRCKIERDDFIMSLPIETVKVLIV